MIISDFLQRNSERFLSPKGTDAGPFKFPYYAGIELEIEGVRDNPPDVSPNKWIKVNDNSLRNNGIELITNGPKGGTALFECLEDLEEALANTDIELSERCSTHIHIDVSDMTVEQLLNFLMLSSIFELVLFKLFGSERTSNTFCMATKDGGNNFDNFCNLAERPDISTLMVSKWTKYNAISLNRIRDLGTVEFRMFNPILEKSKYCRVLYFLFGMKNEAMNIENISDIIAYKKANSLQDLFSKVFPDEEYDEQYYEDIDKGLEIVNDVIISKAVKDLTKERMRVLENEIIKLKGGI